MVDMRQIKAREAADRRRILAVNPLVPHESGIYFLLREEDGIKYGYVGQAVDLLDRLAGHLRGYQHIDLSLKKHGLFSEKNPTGWNVHYIKCEMASLDERERHYIAEMAAAGYQLRNHTTGGQDGGKKALGDAKCPKGYYDGVRQGEKNIRKQVAHLFKLHLDYKPKSDKPNKNQEKAMAKFADLLNWEADDGT